ncbi:MAG: nucleotide sugar dehydrogenase [Alphaproteobacteria bacterium]|nr:nucleotide sugar dehydrogenase [Alphaproteobacteria bacterium]
MPNSPRIAVIGLGYVGLPLAIALAEHDPVVGFDIDADRVADLRAGSDRTKEVDPDRLAATDCRFTAEPADLAGAEIYIVTVPTPVTIDNRPDLTALRTACETVGGVLGPGALVVVESTVYPGVTEEVCGPVLAAASGLTCGRDFFLGYAPERINPGDRTHTLDRITKVVAGQTPEVAERLAALYGRLTTGGVFRAKDIRTAEAAKVIENAQRDINIAFINEVAMIFSRIGLSSEDVLAAARSKWNFLDFRPGLVGGHCIGVDPFYLAHLSQELGHEPEVILAGRRLNDGMGTWVADAVARQVDGPSEASRILVLGLTFKENVPDLRNSKVVDLVVRLQGLGYDVDIHDPLADPGEAEALYRIVLTPELDEAGGYAAVVGAVAHDEYRGLDGGQLARMLRPQGLIADIKGIWRGLSLSDSVRYWAL